MGKCDYKLGSGDVKNKLHQDFDGYQCSRSVWKEGMCIWHAKVPHKPISELRSELRESGKNLTGAVLIDTTFDDNIDLSGCDFMKARIEGCNFKEIGLKDLAAAGATFRRVKFSEVDLTGGHAIQSDMEIVKFDNCNLYDFSFTESNMTSVDLRGNNLTKTSYHDIDLSDENFSGMNFHEAVFVGSDLTGCVIAGGEFTDSDFSGADLTDVDFGGTDLTRCVFRGATLEKTHFGGTDLTDAVFNAVDLTTCEFGGAELKNIHVNSARMANLDLSGLDMSGMSAEDANLSNVDLVGADIRDSDLEGAVLESADLRRTNLDNSKTYQCYMRDVWVDGETKFAHSFYDNSTAAEHDKAARVYRTYQNILRENSLPSLARTYRIREKDARRKQKTDEFPLRGRLGLISRCLWLYAESWQRIMTTSITAIIVFAIGYGYTGIEHLTNVPQSMTILGNTLYLGDFLFNAINSVYFSVSTFTTLGYGDIQPNTLTTRVLAGTEAIIGSLLIAALLFVLGRRATW